MKKISFSGMNGGISVIPAMVVLLFFQGCMYYYKVQTVKPIRSTEIKSYDSLKRYLVLHSGDSVWHFQQSDIRPESFSGKISALPEDHRLYRFTIPGKGNRYKNTRKNNESCVLDEVHIYLTDSLFAPAAKCDTLKIAYSAVSKVEVYKKAKGRTLATWLIPAIGGPLIGAGIIVISIVSYMQNQSFHISFAK